MRYRTNLSVAALATMLMLATLPALAQSAEGAIAQHRPAETLCRPWVSWHIADIDPRFGLTHDDVAKAAEQASSLWNHAAQRQLFQHVEQQGIAISLSYDHRQRFFEDTQLLYQQIESIREEVEERDQALLVSRANFEALADDIDAVNSDIRALSEEANALIEQHGNRRGQVPRRIVQQIDGLRTTVTQLNQRVQDKIEQYYALQEVHNEQVAERNVLAQQHRDLASQLNAQISRQQGATDVGEHGIYIRNHRGRVAVREEVIDVYQVRSWQGLVTILAHEFGHAIGIGHVSESNAIMSARMETQFVDGFPEQLHQADRDALYAVCSRAMQSSRR